MKNLTCCLFVILLLTGCTKKDDFAIPVWHCLEIPFTAEKAYNNPLDGTELCEMDVVFTHADGTEIRRPAFWDGENSFKVRFAPIKPGRWQYRTVCEQERSLSGIKGFIKAVEYDGGLDIYKHGFLTISDNKRFFIHNDGKPFFYLGDTHWSLPFEAFESSNVPGITSQFKHIVDTRIKQGFTVFQSEPIQWKNHTGQDAIYDLTTFGPEVLGGFANLDRKFKYLADKGMVHANAQLFFANELGVKMEKYPYTYIESLTRYWVARYGAYPVMWTCAQEVDNDFYFDREGDQRNFDAENNPWIIVAKSLYKYDAYHHPLTAHMEYASGDAPNDGHGTIASNSSFKNIEGHNWYACQWSPNKKGQLDFRVTKDFWNSQPVKPTVNYEGHYDHFWTNTFGARMQGWTAYLNGMFGYGYGSAGIWLIINSYPDDLAGAYDLHRDTDDEITKEVKRMPWNESLLLPAAEQTGKHMRQFLESLEWWNLSPRFDDAEWSDLKEAYYSLATIENNIYVCYFYNPGTVTGKLKNLNPGNSYTAQWFDPRNGQYRSIGVITSDNDGIWEIPAKPSDDDWVLLLKIPDADNLIVKVGAIRWDAWVGDRWAAGLEVERILSGIPQSDPDAAAVTDYHFRVPWFGVIQPDNKALARYTDILTLEREIRYAKAAGIDYWATVWYGDHDNTAGSLHRNLWTNSLQRNSLQWCHVFDGNFRGAVGDYTTPEQKKLISDMVSIDFKSDMYLKTITGRPVFYIHDAQEAYNVCVNALYAECAAQGVPDPFVITGTFRTDTENINHVVAACRASGISSYVVAGNNDLAYADNAVMEQERWALWNSCDGVAIPTVTAGWDNRPRYYCGCPWYDNIENLRNSWIQYPTLAELQKQVEDAILFTQTNPKANDFKSIIIYAWNEYDEGGFIAPTLFQLQDEANNGRPVKLDAIYRAIQSFRVAYTDIEGHFAANEICQLASSNVFCGVSDDKFCPDQVVNFNEYAAWLVRTFGLYADVSDISIDKADAYAHEIAITRVLGILEGQDARRQETARPITDKEVISLTANVMILLKMSENDADAQRIFKSIPGSRTTRAKAAVMLSRCLELPFKR